MKFIPTELPGVLIVEPDVYRDARGFFLETYGENKYREGGVDVAFVQDNLSRSVRGTLRGLHAQVPRAQAKLLRAVMGEVFDVAVDIRLGSPTFGRWVGVELSAENFRQLYIPCGFAHGFCVMSDVAEIEYKCSDVYVPQDEITIQWDDPAIGVRWPLAEPLLSKRDRAGEPLAKLEARLPIFDRD
ncbi:MAG: dTDP-4-dehydrorhamnose 3,5-epimerase [Deltaproteobacteria bacterium]|nr:dTDP-4-dehydrorhamnose 3,5-epimerase [Deltaproteobacteria bacterium]